MPGELDFVTDIAISVITLFATVILARHMYVNRNKPSAKIDIKDRWRK